MDKSWPLVSLTSDYGWRDHHLARLKGALLRAHRKLQLVDVSHDIPVYDIVRAAFIFRNAYRAFPAGTIHVLSVHDHYAPDSRFLALAQAGHYFIGPDNGVFSLVFNEAPAEAYHLDTSDRQPLPERYARAVAHIARNKPLFEIGLPVPTINRRLSLQPVIGPNYIRGSIVYIDRYDNATVNINRSVFESVGRGRPFQLFFKRHDPIERLVGSYQEVGEGEVFCRFNSEGLLEIAINMGKAAGLLGLHIEDTVQIDFREGESPAPE
jgi:S-adenosyl-L-methionine hydrolase (adenosine-forming)